MAETKWWRDYIIPHKNPSTVELTQSDDFEINGYGFQVLSGAQLNVFLALDGKTGKDDRIQTSNELCLPVEFKKFKVYWVGSGLGNNIPNLPPLIVRVFKLPLAFVAPPPRGPGLYGLPIINDYVCVYSDPDGDVIAATTTIDIINFDVLDHPLVTSNYFLLDFGAATVARLVGYFWGTAAFRFVLNGAQNGGANAHPARSVASVSDPVSGEHFVEVDFPVIPPRTHVRVRNTGGVPITAGGMLFLTTKAS